MGLFGRKPKPILDAVNAFRDALGIARQGPSSADNPADKESVEEDKAVHLHIIESQLVARMLRKLFQDAYVSMDLRKIIVPQLMKGPDDKRYLVHIVSADRRKKFTGFIDEAAETIRTQPRLKDQFDEAARWVNGMMQDLPGIDSSIWYRPAAGAGQPAHFDLHLTGVTDDLARELALLTGQTYDSLKPSRSLSGKDIDIAMDHLNREMVRQALTKSAALNVASSSRPPVLESLPHTPVILPEFDKLKEALGVSSERKARAPERNSEEVFAGRPDDIHLRMYEEDPLMARFLRIIMHEDYEKKRRPSTYKTKSAQIAGHGGRLITWYIPKNDAGAFARKVGHMALTVRAHPELKAQFERGLETARYAEQVPGSRAAVRWVDDESGPCIVVDVEMPQPILFEVSGKIGVNLADVEKNDNKKTGTIPISMTDEAAARVFQELIKKHIPSQDKGRDEGGRNRT